MIIQEEQNESWSHPCCNVHLVFYSLAIERPHLRVYAFISFPLTFTLSLQRNSPTWVQRPALVLDKPPVKEGNHHRHSPKWSFGGETTFSRSVQRVLWSELDLKDGWGMHQGPVRLERRKVCSLLELKS